MNYQEFIDIYAQVINRELERRNIPGKARSGEQKKNGVVKKGLYMDALDGRYSAFFAMSDRYSLDLVKEMIQEEVEFLAKEDVMDFIYGFLDGKNFVHESFWQNIKDPEFVKKAIEPYLFSLKTGDHLMRNLMYREFLDLGIGYRVNIERLYLTNGSFAITRQYAADIGLTEEDLYRIALENAQNHIERISMEKVRLMADDPVQKKEPSDVMEIIRLDSGQYGAGGILVKETLEKYAKEKKTDRISIIPSSVHECIVLPAYASDVSMLKELICEVNRTQVEPDEVLSDSLYYYDLEKGYGKY